MRRNPWTTALSLVRTSSRKRDAGAVQSPKRAKGTPNAVSIQPWWAAIPTAKPPHTPTIPAPAMSRAAMKLFTRITVKGRIRIGNESKSGWVGPTRGDTFGALTCSVETCSVQAFPSHQRCCADPSSRGSGYQPAGIDARGSVLISPPASAQLSRQRYSRSDALPAATPRTLTPSTCHRIEAVCVELFRAEVHEDATEILGVLLDPVVLGFDLSLVQEPEHAFL